MPLFKPNIAALKAKRDVSGLAQALKFKDDQVRRDAARALGELRDKRAAPAIVDLLLAVGNPLHEKIAAADALGKMGDAAAIEPLTKAFAISQEREQTRIDAALESADPQYRANFYVNRISSDEFDVRTAFAQAVGEIGGARAIQTLLEMLAAEKGAMESSVKSNVRAAIAEAVQQSGENALPVLRNALKHSSPQVRQWAAHCLADFNDAASIDALLRAAYDNHEIFDVREAALIALGHVGDARVIPYLEDLEHDENPGIARDAKQCASAVRARIPRKPIE